MKSIKKSIQNNQKLYTIIRPWSRLIKIICFLITQKIDLNYFKCELSAFLRTSKSYGKPFVLSIEPTNVCDQKCTICETGLGILDRDPGTMSLIEFKNIIDQFGKSLKMIVFYFMGESFLNKDAYRMIRYAADKGIYVTACTNGNYVKPKELVESGISDIQFQLSGTSQVTHSKYRVGGNLEKTINNLKDTLFWRDDLKDAVIRPYPMNIGMGFIILKQNEHELEDFYNLAKELKVDEYHVISPCVRNIEQGKEMLPKNEKYWIYNKELFDKGLLSPRRKSNHYCEWIYGTVTIQVNGDVVLCCRDPCGKFVIGNVFKESINQIWNNQKYQELRKKVTGKNENFALCKLCEGYGLPLLKK